VTNEGISVENQQKSMDIYKITSWFVVVVLVFFFKFGLFVRDNIQKDLKKVLCYNNSTKTYNFRK